MRSMHDVKSFLMANAGIFEVLRILCHTCDLAVDLLVWRQFAERTATLQIRADSKTKPVQRKCFSLLLAASGFAGQNKDTR